MVRAALILLLLFSPVCGQDYGFSVPEFTCRVEVNHDRSLLINYDILFQCETGHKSIDVVDIGFPSKDHDPTAVIASIDNNPLELVYASKYIDIGVEVHLGGKAVQPGQNGRFRLSGVNREMVFRDSEKEEYASVEFSPTWFDAGILKGESNFKLEVVFPPGAEPGTVYFHERPFTASRMTPEGRIVYVWQETRRVDSRYDVGISFPAALVAGPLADRPQKPVVSPEAIGAVVSFFIVFVMTALPILFVVKAMRKAKRRLEQYLPPSIGLEGSSVLRGLTAPMAALLLEEKLDRVFLMIIYGMIKKGALRLEAGALNKSGSPEGLRPYEKALLDVIPEQGAITEERVRKIFLDMIDDLKEKMKGYSLKETREYYRSVIDSAWKMVQGDRSADELGVRFAEMFPWLLADRDFASKLQGLPEEKRVRLPAFITVSSPRSTSPASGGGISLAAACSQVAGFLEGTAGGWAGNISQLSRSVTAVSNPVPVSSGSGSSGSGCACACACAGCACACAGGGR